MVTVLTESPEGLTLRQKWRGREVVREQNLLGQKVRLVYVGRRTSWARLEKKLGRPLGPVIGPENLALPERGLWRRYDFAKMEKHLLCNTLLSLRRSGRWVGLWDPEGQLQAETARLMEQYPRVTVWCRDRERYSRLSQELLEELGACPEVTESLSLLESCPLIGALEQPPPSIRWKGVLLLTGKGAEPAEGCLVHSLGVRVPQEVEQFCPKDVEAGKIYWILLRQEKSSAWRTRSYDFGQCGRNQPTLEQIAHRILTIST